VSEELVVGLWELGCLGRKWRFGDDAPLRDRLLGLSGRAAVG
jgi:hypothetical protein